VTKNLEISEDIYQFLEKVSLEKENIKELIEYVHYKAILESFTFIIENNKEANLDFLLKDYVDVISKVQIILNNIKQKHENKNE
jgi:tRNA(Ser,Leu) C12 N-acetylase TAN1